MNFGVLNSNDRENVTKGRVGCAKIRKAVSFKAKNGRTIIFTKYVYFLLKRTTDKILKS